MLHESNEKTTSAGLKSWFLEYNGVIMGFSVNSSTKVARMQHIKTNIDTKIQIQWNKIGKNEILFLTINFDINTLIGAINWILI